MSKRSLLKNLQQQTYCRVGVSPIQGVGVIAIRDIPKNTNPFTLTNDHRMDYKLTHITKSEYNDLPSPTKKMISDFFTAEHDGSYYIPKNGLNSLDITFYLNHSANNNLDIVPDNADFYEFRTNKPIKKNTELTINYKHYDRD